MFFQINVTPKEKKAAKVKKDSEEEQIQPQENYELVLAPFQPQTRIKLETNVYNSVKCSLNIRNPSNRNLNVSITKTPPAERRVALGPSELSVPAENSAQLEISWTPQEAGSWKDNIQLTDSRRIKYDVAIITTARGVKKASKGRSRVLGVANTNRGVETHHILPSITREPKKNLHPNYLGQSTAPSKRPRLNSVEPSNKENVSKIVWRTAKNEETTVSQNPHDFSAIMNSTKFNFTPLKTRNVAPAIVITPSSVMDFSSQETGIISPKTPAMIDIRRETYIAGAGKASNSVQRSHDFSIVINSTDFNFTPLRSKKSCEDLRRVELECRDTTKIIFSPQEVGIVSPEIADLPNLRRETYVTAKSVVKPSGLSFDERDEDEANNENFEDSLSPQPEANANEIDGRKPSEFSMFINDVNFMTPKGQNSAETVNFSPHGCSTGNRTRSLGGKVSSFEHVGNDTFDISGAKIDDNSRGNGTYELPASPKGSKNSDSLKPTRLCRSFDRSSSLEPCLASDAMRTNPSASFCSTPVCHEVFSARTEYSTRTSVSHVSYKKAYDDVSVKEVLEADLWVKSQEDLRYCSSIASSAMKQRCSSLDKISEEIHPPERVIFAPSSKASPMEKTRKTGNYRRIDISPPKKFSSGLKYGVGRRTSPTKSTKIRKERHANEPLANFRKKVQMNYSLKPGKVTIPGVRIANLSLACLNRSSLKDKGTKSEKKEASVKLHDPNDFVTRFCNPDPFGATMTQDPFLTSTLYYDEKWMYHQEMEFKKWLNALLTPPEHLNADVDTIRVDVGKVWQSCRNREDVALAETREAVSARYHTNTRLNTLRKAACAMFRRDEVTTALSKATVCVERGTLMIRQDRDMHRDIGLQKEILELFLSYNPLWLRIGLETVYGETIPLNSNDDLVGLTRFIITRFFSDPFIVKTHSHAGVSSLKLPSFTLSMNKFILKKFLLVVYFLDHAKRNKLIGHDPCLFHKKAPHKESRAILLTFSRQVLSGVGDLTKVLRSHGYVVSHKQTHLDEYDYAVKVIATDLRDGVRLCRVMELITGDRNLTCRCRVPAISRLQKVHNVDLALTALLRCGYNFTGEIDAKSVADGHREKTLSLLWQIIYKYQAPRFEKAAKSLQQWWRSKLWYVRVRYYLRNRRDNAAATIQRAWKCYRARIIADELREEHKRVSAKKEGAVRIIQTYWIRRTKMLDDRRSFLAKKKSVIRLQRWFRRRRETQPYVNEIRIKRRAIETIQGHWRARIIGKRERSNYLILRDSTKKIQAWWRSGRIGRQTSQRYRRLKRSTIFVQSRWRALRSMRMARESFAKKFNAVRTIQRWWRRYLTLKRDRNDYLLKKNAVRTIEAWFIDRKLVNIERNRFEAKREAIIFIQMNFRRYLETRMHVEHLRRSKRACRIIQQWWRSAIIARRYKIMKNSSVIVQRWWRSVRLAKTAAASFENLRRATIIVQKTWRMKNTRRYYHRMKNAALKIETWYKGVSLTRTARRDFVTKRNAVSKLQSWWKLLQIARKRRWEFLEYKRMIMVVQTKWRAKILARKTRLDYSKTRKAVVHVQATWRMIRERRVYLDIVKRNSAARILQKRWRETTQARETRRKYIEYRIACVVIQNRYRDLRISRETREDYLRKRRAAVVIQKNLRTLIVSRYYQRRRKAALVLQARWRARNDCLEARRDFMNLKTATINMQRRYRSKRKSLKTRASYLKLRSSVLNVQRKWRANKSMEEAKKSYREYRRATIVLQSQWRMILERRKYREIQKATMTMQSRYRSKRKSLQTRASYLKLRSSVLNVQRRWRANKSMEVTKKSYREYRRATIVLQSQWRMILERGKYRRIRKAITTIQRKWRAIKIARETEMSYKTLRRSALFVQRRYRANKLRDYARNEYEKTRTKIIWIQRWWRVKMEHRLRDEAAIRIQTWWKSVVAMRECKKDYEEKRLAVKVLQRRYRAYKIGSQTRINYLGILRSALIIQKNWRCFRGEKLLEEWRRARKSAVLSVEKWWIVVLRKKREREEKLAILRREYDAATTIQSAWRGYTVRTSQSDVMKELRERSERAAKAAVPSATVAFILRESMDSLLSCDTIGKLSLCLTNIDTMTRLSSKGCISFCELNLVDKVYWTIAKSNRSNPWLDVCVRCTSILITLAKLQDTKKYIYRVEFIETLARLMTISIEHHVDLFLHLATLLWLLSENPEYAKAVTGCPRTSWLLSNLYVTIDKKKNKPAVGNCNKSRGKEQTAQLPNSKPDFGIKTKRPRLFTTVHHAISSLIKRLKIDSTT